VLTNIAFALDVAMLIVPVTAINFLLRTLIFSTLKLFIATVRMRVMRCRGYAWQVLWLPSMNLPDLRETGVKERGPSSRCSGKRADRISNLHNQRNASGEDSNVVRE